MDHFAGLDVSVKETSICIVDDAGKIVREVKVASEPEALLAALKNPAYHFKRIGLEAGPLSQWLFSALAEAGLPVICVETRHMQAVLKAQHRRLLAIVRDDEVCRRLMTTPGVGPVVALTYRATVDVPARFRKSKAVGAVFGLTCAKYQSGEVDRNGRISRSGDEMMRVMLYKAAQSMLRSNVMVDSLKALDPEWPIREADIAETGYRYCVRACR